MRINPANVARLLVDRFLFEPNSPLNTLEEELASHLIDLIEEARQNGDMVVDIVSDLSLGTQPVEPTPVYDPEADNEEYRVDPNHRADKESVSLDYKKRTVEFWRSGDKRKSSTCLKSFSSVQNTFKRLPNRESLYKWEKQVESGGTHKEKLKIICETTWEKFLACRKEHIIVHDIDLRRWALATARNVNCSNFKASISWLYQFKKSHKIVSRKVTKFVSRRDVQDKEEIENAAVAFQLEISPLIQEIGEGKSINTDQSGFQYEMHSGRTLDIKGTRKIERLVQAKNATTHSFTIMPFVTASGELKSPTYVVLQEMSGTFGPRVRDTLFEAPNLFLSSSKSGKMGKIHLDEWIREVLVPACEDEVLLIVDSWSTFTEENIQRMVPENMQVTVKQIPPGATALVQPFDVYGFRPLKNYMRHIEDFIMLHDVDIVISQRNNTIKLLSLVLNQFQSPRYVPFWKYSWHKAGLVEERPERFVNPVGFAFKDLALDCSHCQSLNMIKCSWCQKNLCFGHFFNDYHICDTFVA